MAIVTPGRNDRCPCGSGRKFKHCCLQEKATEESARLRLRAVEGRVVDALLRFTVKTWGEPLMLHAWEDFWNYEDVPEDLASTPEFDPMFVPFLVLEQGASQTLRRADLIFTRVLTIDGVSLMLGAAPFVVPPRWHTRIIEWREQLFGKRRATRQDLADFDIEIRDLYFEIAAELLDPTPPRLCNTDGDPIGADDADLRTEHDDGRGV